MDKVVSCAAAAAAVAFASVANAGIVNKPVKMYENDSQVASFWVNANLAEYTKFYPMGSSPDGYVMLAWDLRDTSMTVTMEWSPAVQQQSPFGFGTGSVRFELPSEIQFTSFTVASTNNVTGLSNSQLSFSGNSITIRFTGAYDLIFQSSGASFTLNYTSITVPGPGGLAAVALAIGYSRRRR